MRNEATSQDTLDCFTYPGKQFLILVASLLVILFGSLPCRYTPPKRMALVT